MSLIGYLLIIGFCVALFFACRSLMLWYWRVNDMFTETYEIKQYLNAQGDVQEDILEVLKSIEARLENIMDKEKQKSIPEEK